MKNRKLSFRSNPAYGFSVVELIVALTIMTIIVTVGFSAYTYFQTDYGKVSRNLENLSKKDISIKYKIYQDLIDGSKNICPETDWKAEISKLRDCLFNP
jgi:prepilin-type N-terminal cleavage/methylation domain-containing protein